MPDSSDCVESKSRYSLGHALLVSGGKSDKAEAKKALQEAVALVPKHANALADLCELEQKPSSCLRALEVNHNHRAARVSLSRLHDNLKQSYESRFFSRPFAYRRHVCWCEFFCTAKKIYYSTVTTELGGTLQDCFVNRFSSATNAKDCSREW